ncbi:TetR/AcrR family transcriptional regulator [Streptococcus ruminantium]|uniref:TetR/AcrR family transcriptional regulator n=1 Tax=Streptococcus ruminantium TaxID=1917441 RepID=UPI0012DD0FA2|nr:TetR/AcrR family transcriptional regulator [Streptococcus ruminantium]
MVKPDLRFEKTEKAIQDAFLQLLMAKEFTKISVKEICENAQISRNAFYQHYETKEHLYQAIQTDILLAMEDACRPVVDDLANISEAENRQFLDNILIAVNQHKDKIHRLLCSQPAYFSLAFRDMLIKAIIKSSQQFANPINLAFIHIFSGAVASFVSYWLLETDLTLLEAQEQISSILKNWVHSYSF